MNKTTSVVCDPRQVISLHGTQLPFLLGGTGRFLDIIESLNFLIRVIFALVSSSLSYLFSQCQLNTACLPGTVLGAGS